MSDNDKTEMKQNIALFIVVCIICFLILEVTVRALGEYDVDGEFHFKGHRIKPYKTPYNLLVNQIADFEQIERPHVIPDPYFGWAISKNTTPIDERYFSNSLGIRSHREFDLKKPDGIIRIGLFGDSFIYGYDVPLEQSMGYYIENMSSKEFKVEVMNFGSGAYGNDQAYLRWKLIGKNYTPDIVIIGFQPENCKRNVNIIRKFYFKETGILFSKPRFYLNNDSLTLINYPTIPYKDVPVMVKNFETSSLKNFEYYYRSEDYQDNLLYRSKAIAVIFEYIDFFKKSKNDNEENLFYQVNSNESKLCYEIISSFYKEASNNSKVYILHLPLSDGIEKKMNGRDYVYDELLKKFENNFDVINPDQALIQEAEKTSIQSLYVDHYSNKSNYIIANEIYNYIYPELRLMRAQVDSIEGK